MYGYSRRFVRIVLCMKDINGTGKIKPHFVLTSYTPDEDRIMNLLKRFVNNIKKKKKFNSPKFI